MSAQASGLRRVLEVGFAAPLAPLGFVPSKDRRTWSRDTGELCQILSLGKQYGSYSVQWGIVCPELVDVMYAMVYKPGVVGQSVVTGSPGIIRHPARAGSFKAERLETDADVIASGVAEDSAVVAEWMEPLQTRRALWQYLMLNRERTDRRLLVPSKLGLKLFTAAGLAIVDRDPVGCDLLAETAEALVSPITGDVWSGRFARLRALAVGLCPDSQA